MSYWLGDIESFERVSQDETARRLLLRMAHLSKVGRLEPFVAEVAHDPELDEEIRLLVTELAGDETFLLAVEEYLGRTRRVH